MKKHTKLLLAVLMGLAVVILVSYAVIRSGQITALHQQTSLLAAKSTRPESSVADLEQLQKRFPMKADISSFVEKLYTLAQQSGLENVEITTVNQTRKAVIKGQPGRENAPPLVSYQVHIACEGKYQTISTYVKHVQSNDRFSTIISFDMKPDKNLVKLNMIIEILSFEVQHAT